MGGDFLSKCHQKELGSVQPLPPLCILKAGIGSRTTNCVEGLITNIFLFFPSGLLCCLSSLFVSHLFPLLIVPLSLSIHRSPPFPIPIYVCCHGYSLHKGLTSYMRYTHTVENISPLTPYETRRQSQHFSLNMDNTSPTCGVGFMNSLMKVRICATHLYKRLPRLVLGDLERPSRLAWSFLYKRA